MIFQGPERNGFRPDAVFEKKSARETLANTAKKAHVTFMKKCYMGAVLILVYCRIAICVVIFAVIVYDAVCGAAQLLIIINTGRHCC